MANTLVIKRSTTASAAPSSLLDGELAINQTDGLLFWKDDGGVIQSTSLSGSSTPGGSNRQIQFNDSSSFGGSSKLSVQAEGFENITSIDYDDSVTTPLSGITLLNRNIGGEDTLSSISAGDLLETKYASHAGYKRVSLMMADPGSTVISTSGVTASTIGTASSPTLATGDLLLASPRVVFTSASAIDSSAQVMSSVPYLYGGSGSTLGGGFQVIMTFGASSFGSDSRLFAGLVENAPLATVEPSGQGSMLGIGKDETDTNLQYMYIDGGGSVVKVDLGVTLNVTSVYKFIIGCKPSGSTTYITLYEYASGGVTGLYNTNFTSFVNTTNTFLTPIMNVNTGSSSTSPVALDFINISTKTDF